MIEISVVECKTLRSGTRIVVGGIRADQLVPHNFSIPYRDSLTKSGYQRNPQEQRVTKLATDLNKGRVDLPTAILLNLRQKISIESILRNTDNGLVLSLNNDESENVEEKIGPFYVVDGQHRIAALERLIKEDPEKWGGFVVPFVCMIGGTELEEMEQFFVVNSTAKAVRTDLALDLLKQRADVDSRVMRGLIERGEDWKVKSQAITEKLLVDSPIWRRRIKLPNQKKGDTIITSSSFVNSLKILFDSPFFGGASLEDQTKVLDAYWRGIRISCREPFDDDASSFALQKGVGVIAMHTLLVQVIEIIRSRGRSVLDPDSYSEMMTPVLGGLEGDTAEGIVVRGADFWRSGPKGAAGSYSSSSGKRVLQAKLRLMLPRIEIE